MFQFPGLALSRSDGVSPARFPHSDIPGSMLACSSPRLIAACHVLHRRLVPRHPPCALLYLTSTNRWSRIKKHAQNDARFTQSPGLPRVHTALRGAQDPSLTDPCCQEAAAPTRKAGRGCCIAIRVTRKRAGRLSRAFRSARGVNLLGVSRKEVIQPQVPLRLPCYDFAPVTDLAFGRSFPRVRSRTSGTTGFHGVTGGVYKARERIHRGVADPRLLAIPASCSRVADCNPNLDRLFGIGSPSQVRSPLYRPL